MSLMWGKNDNRDHLTRNWNHNNDDLVIIIRPAKDNHGLPVAPPLPDDPETLLDALDAMKRHPTQDEIVEVLRELVRVADDPRSRLSECRAAMVAARDVLAGLDNLNGTPKGG